MNQPVSGNFFIIEAETKLWSGILTMIDKLIYSLLQNNVEFEYSIGFDFSAPENIQFIVMMPEADAANFEVIPDQVFFSSLKNVHIKRDPGLPIHKWNKVQTGMRRSLSRLLIAVYKAGVVEIESVLTLALQCNLAMINVLKKRKIGIKQELDLLYESYCSDDETSEIKNVFDTNREFIRDIKRSILPGESLSCPSGLIEWTHEVENTTDIIPEDDLLNYYKQSVYLIIKHFGLNEDMSMVLTYIIKKLISEEGEAC